MGRHAADDDRIVVPPPPPGRDGSRWSWTDVARLWLVWELAHRRGLVGSTAPGRRLLKAQFWWLSTAERTQVALLEKARPGHLEDCRGGWVAAPDDINFPVRVRRDGSAKLVVFAAGFRHGTRAGHDRGCECLWVPTSQPRWWDHRFVPLWAVEVLPEPGCELVEQRRQAKQWERRFSVAETTPMGVPAVTARRRRGK